MSDGGSREGECQPEPIVTILKEWRIHHTVLRRLREAGYCPVIVPHHDALRVTEIHGLPLTGDDLTLAAMRALKVAGNGYNNPTQHFGREARDMLIRNNGGRERATRAAESEEA